VHPQRRLEIKREARLRVSFQLPSGGATAVPAAATAEVKVCTGGGRGVCKAATMMAAALVIMALCVASQTIGMRPLNKFEDLYQRVRLIIRGETLGVAPRRP
jgi:hypothetical protein